MFRRIISSLKQHSHFISKACRYQYESLLTQRSKKIQKLLSFCHKTYETRGLSLFFQSFHRGFLHPQLKILMLGAVATVDDGRKKSRYFNWTHERLSLSIFDTCQKDIEFIDNLGEKKPCQKCNSKGMQQCYCSVVHRPLQMASNFTLHNSLEKFQSGAVVTDTKNESNWEPYFSKQEFLVWRRKDKSQMYAYKVYARFDDITAADLLHVQTDLNYRKQWDDTAVRLEMIESDPLPETNSHLIYWEMRWPKWFCNRDYVYCRRYFWDYNRQVILIASRTTKHPAYPPFSGKVRVKDYWSLMVIKPYRSFHEPGVHFVLTYYDNPGIPIPESLKSCVTQKQMPDFLKKMYMATKQYASKEKTTNLPSLFRTFNLQHKEFKP